MEGLVMALETRKRTLQTIGKYELFEKIAEGGMGTVYKARDTNNGQTVAIKVVPPNVAKNPVLMKRFEQEYAAANSIDHPNVVRALDFNNVDSSPYLVMEFVDGESLGQRVERTGKIPEAEAIRLIAQVAQALHKAHKQGLIHRDVKPDNVLVTPDGTAKLADLGLAKELETDLNLTRTGRGLGTPHFMAPEQFRNAKNADARCDIYSLAATLYNILTGDLPFQSTGPLDAWMKKINNELVPARDLEPSISERVDWALRRAMSVDREQRPASCREFIEDLTGHSTRKITPSAEINVSDTWYLFYTDDENVTRTVRGTLQGIRRSLREGVMGDAHNVKAARSKSGPFELLHKHPEFRDLVMTLEQATCTTLPIQAGEIAKLTAAAAAEDFSQARRETSQTAPLDAGTGSQSTPPRVRKVRTPIVDLPLGTPVLKRSSSQTMEMIKWAVVLGCAISLAAFGYYFLPLLAR
jgi:eukaryotic-like serine/threonine-protein kinase